ncbi:MAG: PilN domain-containing protein [Gemmatimonadaceae bacterium]|nr:PilN domain-containing protein [Gemmatimonadaceae bacterium]
MSRLFVVLEQHGVHLLIADTPQRAARAQWVECNPGIPSEVRATVHAAIQALITQDGNEPGAATLIVGMTWLDIGEASLPPVDPASQRQLLRRERDRYFVFDEPVAVTLLPSATTNRPMLALACRASWLAEWREVLATHVAADVVIAAPVAVAQSQGNGEWIIPSGSHEPVDASAHVIVEQHRLVQIRRHPAPSPAFRADKATPVEWATVVRGLLLETAFPPEFQLADESAEIAWRRARTRVAIRRAAIAVAAAFALVWLVDSWRDRRLASLERDVVAMTELTAPVLAARERRDRAVVEQSLLAEDAAARTRSPVHVLDRVAERLPREAFVQRAEWDGSLWRIDGSALDAAVLVPRLDAEPTFSGVRSLAPSTRFLDGGRQRSSFSIGFTVKDPAPTAPKTEGTP